MRAGLLVLSALVACGAAGPADDRPDDPGKEITDALVDAVKLIRARHLDEAERKLAAQRALAARDPRLLEKVDYYLATVLTYRGDLAQAQGLVHAHAQSAAARNDSDSEAWMESSLSWLYWAGGDLPSAIASNDRLERLASSEDMDSGERRSWSLQHLWDRTFFLVEQAALAPEAERSTIQARARDVYREYETLAVDTAEASLAALGCWMAWRAGDAENATRLLGRIGLDDDHDARVLYVAMIVATATGDRPRAERARARLGGMVNLLVPLLLRVRPPTAAPPASDGSAPSSAR